MAQASAATDKAEEIEVGWQNALYDTLKKNGVTQFSYVPDAGHRILIDRSLADPDVHSVALTTCLLYTSPSPRDRTRSRMPSSA